MRKKVSRRKKVCYVRVCVCVCARARASVCARARAGKWQNGLGWCGLYRPNDDCRLVADKGNCGNTNASMARIHKLV